MTSVPAVTGRIQTFRALHDSGCFVIPNPWDRGSARVLAGLGFPALATTSSGFAWSMGTADNHVPLDVMLAHLRAIADAVRVPVNADFEGGFAVERVRAARRAIDRSGTGVLLTGRSEGFIVGRPDLDRTIRRLTAYAEAGAECLYAPGIRQADEIAAVVSAVSPRPVNVLVGSDFTTVSELARLGVRRISVGGALARAAWAGFLEAAREIAGHGTFTGLARAVPFAEVNGAFADYV